MRELENPFDIVKATDLTDDQIADYFVDFPAGGLIERVKPTSPMPMIIFGGKGSGKTHLMRYLSYPLVLRQAGGIPERARQSVADKKYLGVYFRCGGLNAQRFAGKGQDADAWSGVFAYCMELWLGQVVLAAMRDLCSDTLDTLAPAIAEAWRLLDIAPEERPPTLEGLAGHLEWLQREADVAINNCALSRRLNITIGVTSGRLIFGLPRVLRRHVGWLRDVLFVYLVDEYENLTEDQQRYVNTLLREREEPCTLKIGVKLYGLRTKQTLSAGEENRENSEYDALRLDEELRNRPDKAQLSFASNLVARRLAQAGYFGANTEKEPDLSKWFEATEGDRLHPEGDALRGRFLEAEAPYLSVLRHKLQQGLKAGVSPGLKTEADVGELLQVLRVPDYPFVERLNVFLLYRAWARQDELRAAAQEIAHHCTRFLASERSTLHQEVLQHFRADVLAQLLRDTKQKQRYIGFETFVRMSAGLPRGLLTILKHVFTWSVFFDEKPFRENKVSLRAQVEGVSQASEWFFTEARAPGPIGTRVRDSMVRLGELLRDLRFSDKPSECSLSTFSANMTAASDEAAQVLKDAENWSMLVRVAGGQHDRNTERVDDKYQVHPMLAPRFDLPTASRGALALSPDEVQAVFAPASDETFRSVLRKRVARMTAPLFGRGPQSGGQAPLPGISHDE